MAMSSARETVSEGLRTFTLERARAAEFFISAPVMEGEPVGNLFRRVAAFLREKGAAVISVEIYGIPVERADGIGLLKTLSDGGEFPVTWIDRGGEAGGPGGLQVWAIRGATVTPVRVDGRIVGTSFEDECARYVRLGGVTTDQPDQPREVQAQDTFVALDRALRVAGMTFADVVRTWFFIEEIDDWYTAFNQARDDFFSSSGVFTHLIPASTGVGGHTPSGSALVGGLLAVAAKTSSSSCGSIASPLQGSPLDYGSSFSRAVELASPDCHRLFISGTASITGDGRTEFTGDMAGQIARTWEVVEAILTSRGMGWGDVARGIAYIKHARDRGLLEEFMASREAVFPVLLFDTDICRDELLFELEVDAIRRV